MLAAVLYSRSTQDIFVDLEKLIDNRSPMAVRCFPMDDRNGRDIMVVIAKLTYEVSSFGAASLAFPPSPVRTSDEPVNESRWSSIRYPADLVEDKPGTDVLLVGTAHPQRGATRVDVSLRVEAGTHTIQKAVRVHGRRVFMSGMLGPTPGPAEPLGPTPLIYELAYGGYDDSDPTDIRIDRRNPAGIGVVRQRERLVGTLAPQIEDPVVGLGGRGPMPVGFGAIPASWEPRLSRAGTYDAAWRRDRAPLPPVDRDPRFNCTAPDDLHSDVPLHGDEPVEVLGATPEGVWRFRLPRHAATFRSVVRGVIQDHPTHLDTFLVDADHRRVELTWRASFPMPRRVGYIETILVGVSPPFPDAMIEELAAKIELHREGGLS